MAVHIAQPRSHCSAEPLHIKLPMQQSPMSCSVLEHLALTAGFMSWSVCGWQTSQSCTLYSASCMQHTPPLGISGTFWSKSAGLAERGLLQHWAVAHPATAGALTQSSAACAVPTTPLLTD